MTRKVGLIFEEDKDVIVEVYNSWYSLFGIIRELLKDIEPRRKDVNMEKLEEILIKTLNEGLRPHLTKWQAKFRKWYEYDMRKIREDYLTDSTVTIVLIGDETWKRKYVDWEIASTLRNDPNNKRSGLIGIFLPGKNSSNTKIPERLQDNIDIGYAKLYKYPDYAYAELEKWIDEAYDRKDDSSYEVDNTRPLYKYNRS